MSYRLYLIQPELMDLFLGTTFDNPFFSDGPIIFIEEAKEIERKAFDELIESIAIPTAAEVVDSLEPIKPWRVVGQDSVLKGERVKRPKVREGAGEPVRGPPFC
jgi:hypothetical protein